MVENVYDMYMTETVKDNVEDSVNSGGNGTGSPSMSQQPNNPMTQHPTDLTTQHTRLRVVVVGHVDHGKSTLIGRIFHDTGSMPEGKVESIRKACEAEGMPFEYAFLLDALLEEQEQNITIDTTRIPFRTQKRGYEIIDAPGHKEFLKNMITGAASADAAILLIDASEGVQEQSRRHGYLLRLLGVGQIAVAVNKMDRRGYDREVFERIREEYTRFLGELGVTAQQFIPISAREGDNIARRATDTMSWYDGPTILETLDSFALPQPPVDRPLRFVVQDIYRFDTRRLIAGRVETGRVQVGDVLTFSPGGKRSRVASIERWSAPPQSVAVAGESIALTLEEQIFAERGHVATPDTEAPFTAPTFRASLFWMSDQPWAVGEKLRLKLATQETFARIVRIENITDASTLETASGEGKAVAKNDVAEVVLEADRPLAFDLHDTNPVLGRFVVVQNRRVAGGGIVLGAEGASARNIVAQDTGVTFAERARRNGHRGAVIWLTGLSGAGKSTIAGAVHRALFERGMQTTLLDGDNLRHGLCADLGFGEDDRKENIRRAAHVARLFAESGLITLTAFISPFRADRDAARAIAAAGKVPFVEVFVDASVAACEARDPKGLYRRARAGEIKQFTGIDSPYEPPTHPELHLRTETVTVSDAADHLLEHILTVVSGRATGPIDFEI
ncbi:MAG: adenylyl-sulfate kinase [Armatimonadaceae bacterium]